MRPCKASYSEGQMSVIESIFAESLGSRRTDLLKG